MPWQQDQSVLATLMDLSVDGVIVIDADDRVLMFNAACEKLFGHAARDVVGHSVTRVLPTSFRAAARHKGVAGPPSARAADAPGAKPGGDHGRPMTGRRRDGTTFTVQVSAGETNVDGKPAFIGVIRDLSEREHTARVLTEAVASIKAVVDTVVDGVIMIDAQGTVHMFNPACEHMFGYRSDEVIGRNVAMLMPDAFGSEYDRHLENYRRTGVSEMIGASREVTGRRKDGGIFPMALSVGEPIADSDAIFVGIIRDLTESKRAEQELREIAGRLKALIDTAVDGVMMFNAEGKILTVNPACEKLFGYTAEEMIGTNVGMLMPFPAGDGPADGVGAREVEGRRRDGSTFPMELSIGKAEENGEAVCVAIVHDISERKQTEAQLVQAQKMETVGQLSGGIAHDFNNLLTVVVGNAEVLSELLKGRADMQALADAIVQAGDRGAELTQRLLAFSRRQTLQPVEVDCNALVAGTEKLLRRMLAETISIRTILEGDLWTAYADPGQLENALLNLAINARDAMPDGGSLTITTGNVPLDARYRDLHPEVNPGAYVMVAVTDTGCGMSKDVLEHVFEPFFTTKEVGKGSGLGLSMVYGFVKQSNGHVAIYSEPGLGTTVRLYLPATTAAETAPTLVPTQAATPPGRECVLVAEDDPFVRSFAITCLSSLGYRVIEANDGRDALQKLSEADGVDVLFTDVVMPGGINGWELAEQARELRPGLKVLLTSGYALETLSEQGRLPRGAVVLNKPYRKAELAKRLREAIDVT